MMAVCFISCNNTDSDYETEQAEFVREKAEFQKEQKALRKSVRKEHNTNSVKRDTTMHN